ncbi:SAM-dependent methyltransferase [Paracraurococcus lichenis]|uniref:Class I SAM-dependent methyltransferase n=1 Tax=Paracraurococcus lichenis TaxID=3064888 RepID=A0ABT9DZQ4_9PROT|nr:class I SAM-dependent methyltransferase [Paracraurococcus sp. LOR1-02]MDO9709377.1 class I SAM-dependent methyltransferase [Paracraurococcus sp. LOR1-02]
MADWRREEFLNTIKAAIPGKQALRQGMRRIKPYQTDPQIDNNLFENAIRQIEMLRRAGLDVRGRRVLEIGSGWHPILPVVFIASGAESVALTDVERLLDLRLIRSAIQFVLTKRELLAERVGADRFDRLEVDDTNLITQLNRLGLTYQVPYRTSDTPDAAMDLIVSCSVLEHISPKLLEAMMSDFWRILAPGGAMVHFVDCSDHRAMSDKSLSRCDFLRYEDRVWRLLCLNPQSYHNRLRHSDLKAVLQKAGFEIRAEWRETRSRELEELSTIPLAKRFRSRNLEDLAAISSHFVACV